MLSQERHDRLNDFMIGRVHRDDTDLDPSPGHATVWLE